MPPSSSSSTSTRRTNNRPSPPPPSRHRPNAPHNDNDNNNDPASSYAMSLAEADMSLDDDHTTSTTNHNNAHNKTFDTTHTFSPSFLSSPNPQHRRHHHHPYETEETTTTNNNNTTNNTQPPNYSQWNITDAKYELQKATSLLTKYGLKLASKWTAEQLIGLPPTPTPPTTTTPQPQKTLLDNCTFTLAKEEDDITLYAKTLFDLGEYERAALILSSPSTNRMKGGGGGSGGGSTIPPPLEDLTSLGFFIRSYSLFMAGERRKEEEVVELREPLERTSLRNPNLSQLATELYDYYSSGCLDAFGLYIYGVVLKELNETSPSKLRVVHHPSTHHHHNNNNESYNTTPTPHSILLQSILNFPFNWSAWLDLSELCVKDQSIHSEVEDTLRPISAHWMYHFFCVHLFLEDQKNENAISVMERLIHGTEVMLDQDGGGGGGGGGMFVQSPYIQSQLAVAYYNRRDFDEAQRHFVALSERDPLRLDQMDVYSNILYVKEDRVSLSQLAHRAVKVDKYRPETCCIVGNYYSLKAQHEKAVQYFQRALKLDRTYLSAWTLMGHEYVEMKNTAAAIEAYRRAVDINDRDYRAWYGLGQTYEILNMLFYALFYFTKAAALRPYDARMWCAIGGCYLGLDRRADAIRSYERAVSNSDTEGIATRKLATLYREDGDVESAAKHYLHHLELRFQAQQVHPPSDGGYLGENDIERVVNSVQVDAPEAEALLYLAYYHRDNGEYETAAICCSRLLEYPGPEKEEGKALLREIRSRMDRRGDGKEGGGIRRERRVKTSRGTSQMMEAMTRNRSMRGGNDNSLDSSAAVESSFEFSP